MTTDMSFAPSAEKLLSFVDLTTLNGDETEADLQALVSNARIGAHRVAALCVYPQFVQQTRALLSETLPIAAVANFPGGSAELAAAEASVAEAVACGADEIDYVLPWQALIAGDEQLVKTALKQARAACGKTHLKVIIESGELKSATLIEKASRLSIDAGADFIKTSTGKVAVNATREAADIMLGVIADGNRHVGFKPAGGIKTIADATAYYSIAARHLGESWITPETFRIGASSLLAELKQALDA